MQFSARLVVDFLSAKRWLGVLSLILIVSRLCGQDTWQGETGSWFTSTSWSLGAPPMGDQNAAVDNGTTVQIPVPPSGTPVATAANLTIGATTDGSTVQLFGGNLGSQTHAVSVTIDSHGTFEFSGGFHFGSMEDNGTILFDTAPRQTLSLVSGSGRIIINGIALTLDGENTFNGTTTISFGGSLRIGIGGTLGSIGGNITNNGLLTFDRSDTLTFAGIISGPGDVQQNGTGTTVLTGNNTYTGDTIINAGTLQLGNGGTTGNTIGNSVDDEGMLAFDRSNVLAFAGTISGKGSVQQNGTGTIILTGNNTYTGGTTINAGTLQIGNGGTTGSIGGNVFDKGTLIFDRSDTITFSGAISGSGNLVQSGGGILTLSGTNSYTGTTTVNAGVLQAGSASAFSPTSAFIVNAGAVLSLDGFDSTVGSLSGAGIVTTTVFGVKTPSSIMLTVGTNNVSTTFSGKLEEGTGLALVLNKVGTGTLILTGNNTYSGGTMISAGMLQLGSGGTTGSITGAVTDNGILAFDLSDSIIFDGVISGTGSVQQIGTGTTVLTGNNTYSGGTTVSAGTLQLGNGGTTGSITGNVIDNGILVFNRSNSIVFDGVISGSGSVQQIGSGTTVLTGNNTYSGGTTVSAGTLQLGNGGTSGSITGNVVDNGILAFNRSDVVTFGGVISGTGSLQQNGTGTTVLVMDNTYTGTTTVNSGSLIVDGSIASTQTLVNADGFLGGHGTINGNVVNSGIVGQFKSPGTLTITGNYTQNPGGTLRIQIAGMGTGQHDLLAVNGHAALAGTLQLIPLQGFNLHPGDQITFLTANNGVSGTFSNVSTGTILQGEVTSLPNAVVLKATQGSFATTPGVAITPNNFAVAKALDSAAGDPRAAALFAFLNSEPLANLPHDLTLIAPTQISSMNATSVSLGNVQASNVGQRLANVRGGSTGFSAAGFTINGSTPGFSSGLSGPTGTEGKAGPSVLAPVPENRWGVFLTGLGEFTNVDSTSNAAGYDVDTGGFTLGVDYRLTPNFAIGLFGGYAHTNVNLVGGGNIDVNGGKIGLYTTVFRDGFYLDAAVSGGPSGYDTRRTALQGNASGTTDGSDLNVLVAAGYDWKCGNLSIGPTASFQFSYVGLDGFTETGSLAPLKFPDQNTESERTAFGAKASYDWKIGHITAIPLISAAWQHEYGATAYSVVANFANGAGNSFTVNGPEIGRDSLLIGAGVSVLWSDRISTYVYYDGEFGRTNYQSNNISGGIRVTF
ncbi:MAG: autotransporter-associated beta strand repeat-containing protein [Chthoniobacterales bacterium]